MKSRLLGLAVVLVLAVLVAPACAFAHASLRDPSPGYRERLAAGPAAVVLRFDQAVTVFPASIVVLDARGRIFSDQAASGADPRVVLAPVRTLPRGMVIP